MITPTNPSNRLAAARAAGLALAIVAIAITALVPLDAAAQDATARITGRVVDAQGEPVAGLKVKLLPEDPAEFTHEAETSKRGRFTFPNVNAVTYTPSIESQEYVLERVEADVRAPDGTPVGEYAEPDVRRNGSPKMGILATSRISLDLVVSRIETAQAGAPGDVGMASVADASREVDQLNALFELGRWEELVEHGERVVGDSPDEGGAHYLLGVGLWKLGRHAEAAEHLGRATELIPDQPGIHGVAGAQLVEHGQIEQQAGDTAAAQALYERALSALELQLAETPGARPHLINVVIAAEGAGRTDRAVAVLRELVATDPADSRARMRLAELLVELEQPTEAIELLVGMPDTSASKTAELIYNAAVTIWNAGDMDATIAAVERAIALESDNPEFYRLKGRAHLSKGDDAEAIAALEQAVALDPEHPAAATDRALIERLRVGRGG